MIKRANTPVNPPKHTEPLREGPRRVFGKDLKNIIANYHNKLNQLSSSPNKGSLDHANIKNKRDARNASQKILKKDQPQKRLKTSLTLKQQKKSPEQSTEASPKSCTLKQYLKSRAPQAMSQLSPDLTISPQMRELVIVWIIELAHKMPIKHQTLFHCVLMFDYMLRHYRNGNFTGMVICVENLQLLALGCLFISAKYEEIYPPSADFMVKNSDYAYSKKKIIQMEASILLEQQFILTFPTRYTFLEQLLNEITELETQKKKRLEHMSLFLLELSLVQLWEDTTEEQMAQAAMFLAKKIISMEVETPNRKVCQITWKLMQVWKSKKHISIYFVFDSDRYSFVGGIYLEDI